MEAIYTLIILQLNFQAYLWRNLVHGIGQKLERSSMSHRFQMRYRRFRLALTTAGKRVTSTMVDFDHQYNLHPSPPPSPTKVFGQNGKLQRRSLSLAFAAFREDRSALMRTLPPQTAFWSKIYQAYSEPLHWRRRTHASSSGDVGGCNIACRHPIREPWLVPSGLATM